MKAVSSNASTYENRLITMLWNKMNSEEETPRELAAHLNISYVYLMALSRGDRPICKADRKIFVDMARYLNLPVAQVYLLSGTMKPEDFVVEETIESKFGNLFEKMRSDSQWAGFVPTDKQIEKLPTDVKILLGLLYERATNETTISAVVVAQ